MPGWEKFARHALDRLKERTTLDPAIIGELDDMASRKTDEGIAPGHYYSHLPDNQGYAAFKTVGENQRQLVLATILARYMRPRGTELKQADEMDPEIQDRFKQLTTLLNRRGVYAGTGHRRITIPKNKLSEPDIRTLGFEPVHMAIPESGQDRLTSFRHPDNTYHLHSHGDRWTMHRDRHPAATMLARRQGALKSMAQGAPHVVTEGIPGLYYYLKGQLFRRGSTADQVDELLRPDVKAQISNLSPTKAAADDDEDHTLRNVGMAGAAALPWAGTIGQQPPVHANAGPAVASEHVLRKMLQPGDVLLSGDRDFSPFKGLVGAATGHPEGFHTLTVDRDRHMVESTPDGGLNRARNLLRGGNRVQVLRPNFSSEQHAEYQANLDRFKKVHSDFSAAARSELHKGGLRGPALTQAAGAARGGTYSLGDAVRSGAKDLFWPKLKTDPEIEASRAAVQTARQNFKPESAARAASTRWSRFGRGPLAERQVPFTGTAGCVGSTCSSLPATAMPAGHRVVPGKLPTDVVPSDYLRSNAYRPVANFNPVGGLKPHEQLLKWGPTALRGGLGLAGAAGVYALAKRFGRKPEEKRADETEDPAPSALRRWGPGLAAAGIAGVGAFKYLRTPSFSSNPALAKIQRNAASKGFHPVVDTTPESVRPLQSNSLADRANRWFKPQVDAQGKLSPWNKLKMWARGGSEAIPVYQKKTPSGMRTHLADTTSKSIHTRGVVYERANDSDLVKRIQGGTDLEGARPTQRAVTQLGTHGKDFEADLLQEHAPGSIPYTVSDLAKIPGAANATRSNRTEATRRLQETLRTHFKSKGHDNFFLKPTQGVASGGKFPSAEGDWGAHLEKYKQHLRDPGARRAFAAARGSSDSDFAGYLRNNGIYEGHVLSKAVRYPGDLMAQAAIPKAQQLGEFRVHTADGTAPTELIMPRHPSSLWSNLTSPVNKDQLRHFVENDVLAKLPAKYRKGMYGMDVMPHRTPDGSVGFKVLEMNPYERGGASSGLLDSDIMPGSTHKLIRAVTGRHSEPVSVAGGLGAAALAGGAARALTSDDGNQKKELA